MLGQTDVEMLEDLIKAAVSAAQAKAIQATKQAMAEITGELNIPGLDGLLG
jgi:DNA-binding protein YbaB